MICNVTHVTIDIIILARFSSYQVSQYKPSSSYQVSHDSGHLMSHHTPRLSPRRLSSEVSSFQLPEETQTLGKTSELFAGAGHTHHPGC